MRKNLGVTLIELILVVALVVVFSGLVTVGFARSFEARNLDHFVKELTAYLRYLQFKAVEEGAIHKLTVNVDSGAIEIFMADRNATDFKEVITPFSGRFKRKDYFSVRLQDGKEVYFFPDGRVTPNKFVVTGDNEKTATVEIKNRIGAFQVTLHD